jgi:predicted O-methyltransferase YrrM
MKGNALFHLLKYYGGIDRPHTQTTPAEQAAVRQYATGRKRAVEIGVYEGVNTQIIASSLASDGKLYGVDPFVRGRLGVCYYEMIARRHIGSELLRSKVRLVTAFSHDAAVLIPDYLDFIFIDGDHSLEGITRDWSLYAPKLDSGGLMLLHDTTAPMSGSPVEKFGSCRYFETTIRHDERFRHLATVDSLNILQRI